MAWYQGQALLKSGKLDLSPLITHTLPLAEIAKGMDLLREGQAAKVILYPLAARRYSGFANTTNTPAAKKSRPIAATKKGVSQSPRKLCRRAPAGYAGS